MTRKSEPFTLAPEFLSADQWSSLWAWRDNHHPDLTDDELSLAWRIVYQWSHGSYKYRARWLPVLQNAIDKGWALKGVSRGSDQTDRHRHSLENTFKRIAARDAQRASGAGLAGGCETPVGEDSQAILEPQLGPGRQGDED